MAGSKEGAAKARLKEIEKYGSEEAWRQVMRERGAKADRTTPRGFAVIDKERVREISRKAAKIRWEKHRAEKEDGA